MKGKVLKNIMMVLSSNVLLLILGITISFILPLFFSIEEYAYWQLYLYYSGFVGVFVLGFNDGFNLRYAGNKIETLNGNLFKSFFGVVIGMSTMITAIAIVLSFFLENYLIFVFVSLNIAIFNVNGFCIHVNQMTKRFKEYSIANIIERVLFVISIPILLLIDKSGYVSFILLNLLCRIIAMTYNIISIRELFYYDSNQVPNKYNLNEEIYENFKGGFPLMLASICSMLMTTVPRVVVENVFSITEYGLFAFGYASINLVIIIITAMSTVIYPTLKSIRFTKQKEYYMIIKKSVLLFCTTALFSYYFVVLIINVFYQRYILVLDYLPMLFPVLVYQSFNSLVIANYSRVLRLEKYYLYNNILFLALNFCLTFFIALKINSIPILLLMSVIVMHIWSIISDRLITRTMQLKKERVNHLNITLLLVVIFIAGNTFLRNNTAMVLYFISNSFILFLQRETFVEIYKSYVKERK